MLDAAAVEFEAVAMAEAAAASIMAAVIIALEEALGHEEKAVASSAGDMTSAARRYTSRNVFAHSSRSTAFFVKMLTKKCASFVTACSAPYRSLQERVGGWECAWHGHGSCGKQARARARA